MADRIYVTYSPTVAPESYHAAVHYVRTDTAANVIQHLVIEGFPQKGDQLNAFEKGYGVVEEMLRQDNGASRFGTIQATVRNAEQGDQDLPYEPIAEGPDLSSSLVRMQQYVDSPAHPPSTFTVR